MELSEYLFILKGTKNTIIFSSISASIGFLLGLTLSILKIFYKGIHQSIIGFIVSLLRGTPLIVQLMTFHFGIKYFLSVPSYLSTLIVLSINSSAYFTFIISDLIKSIPTLQYKVAINLGYSKIGYIRYILLPQILRGSIGSLLNELNSLIKETSIIRVLGVMEIYSNAEKVGMNNQSYIGPMVFAALLYFSLSMLIEKTINYFINDK